MSQEAGDMGEEAARKPGRATSSGSHRGRGVGQPSMSLDRSFGFQFQPAPALGPTWIPARLPPHLPFAFPVLPEPRPWHHGEPSKEFSGLFDSMNLKGIPKFPATTSTANPCLDKHKFNQALPEENVASSTPVQVDLKQHPLQYQPANMFVGPLMNTDEIARAKAHEDLKHGNRMKPCPVTPMQIMHKSEGQYVAGKVPVLKEVKQRQLNAILNKLTPKNLLELLKQMEEVNIVDVATLSWFVSQIWYRVLAEPTSSEVYANFCCQLAYSLPDLSEDNEKITFKRLLLNRCQMEFERGVRKEVKTGKSEGEDEVKQTKEEREERRMCARRHMLGSSGFIGELYKKRMLTERIMHECIKKLIGDLGNPNEENIEGLCKLMSTVGEVIDHPKAKECMDVYFEMMHKLSTSQKLPYRVRFLLRDLIDLRKEKWQHRCKMVLH
ncbi:hypothetical protein BS78_01G150300 [Paspalum vaginatum]|nr:hypothetical protein BS78_01G150300 [Paspalum vaginatum]